VNSRILANHIAQAQPIKSESSMGGSDRMKAIVIFWILVSLSFLEATLHESGPLTSDQEVTIRTKKYWSKKSFLKCLEGDWRDEAEELLKIGIENSPDSVKDIIIGFHRERQC
jgi:hypothetical protein